VSSQHVTATGGFAYGVVGADIHVFGDGTPLYVLENWRPAPELDSAWLSEQPSRMLNARFAVVEFTGRDRELGELRSWCTAASLRAARWLHAPAGQGKTRLADQLALEVGTLDWKVVTATEGPGSVLPPPGSQDLRLDGSAGLLLLVDYADRWPLRTLTWLFSNALLHQPEIPTRVLLLSRSVDPWPALRAALVNQQVLASTQALPPLDASGPGPRTAMFRAARDGFAARYGIAPPDGQPDLEHPDFGLTLAVHMAALVAVDASVTGRRAPADLAGLTVYLLDREQLNWARLHQDRGHGRISTPPPVMNRAVFAASLVGTQPADNGAELMESLRVGHPTTAVLADHAVCYPPPDAARGTVLEPLYPDRLAEDFVALTLPGHPADYPAQSWAPGTAATVVLHGSRPGRSVTALATAAGRWPHVGRECLYPLLAADPGLAVAAGGPALTALAGLPDIEPELLEDLVGHVPEPVPADLVVGRATVLVRLLDHRLAGTDDPAEHARLFVNHGNNLTDIGRDEEALAAGRRSVELFGGLAAAEPQEYDHHLARALTNLASQLQRVGRPTEALEVQERVLGIFERLAATDRVEHEPDLATALANLANHLEPAGRWEEAYRVTQKAVETYRRLAERDPHYRRGLAIALTNTVALTLRGPGQETGPDPVSEAVTIWRQLTATDPVTHEPDLGIALVNLRKDLSCAGRHAAAVAATEEAVAIYRRLAQANPSEYADVLANALDLLRSSLTDAGRHSEAVAAGSESVAVSRRLATDAPATYQRSLLAALRGQNDALAAAGLPQDPEAHALSPKVSLNDLVVRQPAVTITVYGWDPTALPERLPPPGQLDASATRLAKAGDWPGYWELVSLAPIADAIRLARRIPLRRWSPPDGDDRELLMRLRATNARRTAALVARGAEAATTRLPAELDSFGDHVSFAHGRAALAVAAIDSDWREVIETLDISSGRRATLYRGEGGHSSIACLGPTEVVAARQLDGDRPHNELVRHTGTGTTVLARADVLGGVRVAPTADGYVTGLKLAPAALVHNRRDGLRQADLKDWGLLRGDLLAVNPSGDRLVICDGYRLVAADAALRTALAAAAVPQEHGDVTDLVFADADLLLTSERNGGLALWKLNGFQLTLEAWQDTPPLDNLFAVPLWRVVGGKAFSEARIYFFDSVTLAPAAAPASLIGKADHLRMFTTSSDGRFVAYAGQLAADAPRRHRSFEWFTRLHDLHHPGAVLQRPLAGLGSAELAGLATAWSDDTRLRELSALAHAVARRSSFRPGTRW